MKMKKTILLSIIAVVTLVIVLVLRQISTSGDNYKTISGTVTEVTEGGVKDMVITLSGHSEIYYINRGLEKDFRLNEMNEKLKGKEVAVTFSNHWNPFDKNNLNRHIIELRLNEEIVFSELSKRSYLNK